MKLHHRALHLARKQQLERREGKLDGLLDRFALVGRGLAKHVVDHLGPDARVPDAQAQPPEVGGAELGLDVLQAVVPGRAAALLELHVSRQQVEFVVRDEDLLRLDLEEARERGNRLAGQVHVRHRREQVERPRGTVHARDIAEVAAVGGERRAQLASGAGQPPEARIVSGRGVFRPRIAEPDEKANHDAIIECEGHEKAPRVRGR